MSLPVDDPKKDLHERLAEWAKNRPPPPFPSSSSSSYSQPSTISISEQGNLAMLCADNKLWIGTSQYSGNYERTIDLPPDADKTITNIEFNLDGSLLMLYGPRSIGVISFPAAAMLRQIKKSENSTTSFLDAADLSIINLIPHLSKEKDFKIVKCQWHPYSKSHVVILLGGLVGPLLVVDILSEVVQEFPLTHILSPIVSFTFGPALGWLRFAVIFVTIKGDVYVLCPVIPDGAEIDPSSVESLWQESDKMSRSENYENAAPEEYARLIQYFMYEAFGPRVFLMSNMKKNKYPEMIKMRAPTEIPFRDNESSNKPFAEDFKRNAMNVQDLRTMAPSRFFPSEEWVAVPQEVDVTTNRHNNQSQDHDVRIKACDICASSSAPIVTIVYNSGEVKALAFLGDVAPLWKCANEEEAKRSFLMCVSSIKPEKVFEEKHVYSLRNDPLHGECFHIINRTKGYAAFWKLNFLDAFNDYARSEHSTKPKFSEEFTSLIPLFHSDEDNEGLSGWTLVSDPLHGHVALYRSLDGLISNVIMTAELKLHELRKKQEKMTKGFNNQRETASKEFQKDEIKNRLKQNASFEEACGSSILKAREGLKGWKRMEFEEGEDDLSKIKKTTAMIEYLESNYVIHLQELRARIKAQDEMVQSTTRLQNSILEDLQHEIKSKKVFENVKKFETRIDKYYDKAESMRERLLETSRKLHNAMCRKYGEDAVLSETEKKALQRLKALKTEAVYLAGEVEKAKKNLRRQQPTDDDKLMSALSESSAPGRILDGPSQEPTSAQKLPASQPIEFVSPLEKSKTNITTIESPAFSPSPLKKAGIGGLTPNSNISDIYSPFKQNKSMSSFSDVYRATRGSGNVFTPSRGSMMKGNGVTPLARSNKVVSSGARVTGGVNKTIPGENLARKRQEIQQRQEQREREPFQLDDKTLELCKGILSDEQAMLAQAKEELAFLREQLFDIEITKY